MGRYALIIVAGFAVIYGILRLNMNRVATATAAVASERYKYTCAKDLANSAVSWCLYHLGQDSTWRDSSGTLQMYGGTATFQVLTAGVTPDCVTINATGTVYDTTAYVAALVRFGLGTWLLGHTQSVITANSNVKANGNLDIDGRDHPDTPPYNANNVNPGQGVKAIETTSTFNYQGAGNLKLGGTMDSGVDQSLTGNAQYWPPIIRENWSFPNGYPTSPDSVMGGPNNGYPEGTLMQMAMSGLNGSQYVTDPAQLQYPLHGVTYVNLPANQNQWQGVDFGPESEGILVVHNAPHTAEIKSMNGGMFKGVIITDKMSTFHCNMLGVIFTLAPGQGNQGTVIGNGPGWIYYSKQAIKQAIRGAGINTLVAILSYWE